MWLQGWHELRLYFFLPMLQNCGLNTVYTGRFPSSKNPTSKAHLWRPWFCDFQKIRAVALGCQSAVWQCHRGWLQQDWLPDHLFGKHRPNGTNFNVPALLGRHYSSTCKLPPYKSFLDLDFRFLLLKITHFGRVYLGFDGAYITGEIQDICKTW